VTKKAELLTNDKSQRDASQENNKSGKIDLNRQSSKQTKSNS
jgi:hypothetical protein